MATDPQVDQLEDPAPYERLRRKSEGLFLRDDEMPDDPPPTEAPPPVPGGTEDITRGAKPETEQR
jgi:hypothetical protein